MYASQDFIAAADYIIAWLAYGIAAAVLLGLQAWVTRRWQRNLRWLLLGLAAVLLLTPAPVPGHDILAPAFMFVAFAALGQADAAELAPVLVKLALLALGVVVFVVVEGMWWRQRQAAAERRADLERRRAA
ncbi:MAG: hypothetical protein RBS88_04290 [Spongiibacteraceae bacterium]|jgi:hypothetical protein|nr:hypothetical protein [Spongiibacteraceae bacterium]